MGGRCRNRARRGPLALLFMVILIVISWLFVVIHSCMAQEGRESNWSDSSANGLDKISVSTPSGGWLEDYLSQKNAVKSVAGVCHSLSICIVCPTGHNSDSSQVRFDDGEHFLVMLSCRRLRMGRLPGPCPRAWILVDLRIMLWTSPLLMTTRTCFPLTLKCPTLSCWGR